MAWQICAGYHRPQRQFFLLFLRNHSAIANHINMADFDWPREHNTSKAKNELIIQIKKINQLSYHIIVLKTSSTLEKTRNSKCKVFNRSMRQSFTPLCVPSKINRKQRKYLSPHSQIPNNF